VGWWMISIFPPLFNWIGWKVEIHLTHLVQVGNTSWVSSYPGGAEPWPCAVTWDALVLDRATAASDLRDWRLDQWHGMAWHCIHLFIFPRLHSPLRSRPKTKTIGPSSKDLDGVGTVYRFSTCSISYLLLSLRELYLLE
jgi:hypothetical protein